MNYRITDPDYVTLTVTVGVRATVSVTVQIQVPRADADDLDLDAEDAVGSRDAEITDTSEADGDTFNDPDNLETLNQAAAEALADYRATLGGA